MNEPSTQGMSTEPTAAFRDARDFLLSHRGDYDTAYRDFRWPALTEFNYATDWFDVLAEEQPSQVALWLVEDDGSDETLTFAELSNLSQRFAGHLSRAGIRPGDRVLL